jgi:hypothetical protein
MAIGRSNQPLQTGQIVNGALTGTGSAATLVAAPGAGLFADITMLVISGTATDSAVLSDGTNSYTFKIGASAPLVVYLPIPLKASAAATGWTLNMASTSFAAWQAIILNS